MLRLPTLQSWHGLTLLHLRLSPDQVVIVQLDGSDATRPHEVLRLSVDPRLCHVFDERGEALPHLETHHLAA